MQTVSKIVIFAMLLLSVASLFPSACAESWEDIARTAKDNDALVSASKQLDSAGWSYNKAWSNFLPQLSLSGSYNETTTGATGEPTKSYSYGLNGTQYLFKGFQNYYALRSSYANYQYTMASFKKAESDVYLNLRTAFVGLSFAQEDFDLSKKILAQLKENARLIKLRYESGREDRGNFLTTVASEKNAQAQVSAAERELELSMLKLSQLTSLEVKAAQGELTASLEADPDFASLLNNSPDLLMAKHKLEIADISAANTVGEFLPTVSLSGNYSKRGDEWPPESESKSWSLNLSYSFFPGGANIADKLINDLNLDAARRDFEASRKNTLYSIEDAFRKAKDALDALEVKRVYLEAARERSKIADAKYLNGLIAYDEWNRITNDYISAQKDFLKSRRSALEASASWKNSFGGKEI
jgi:outer membrane protein TolC